MKKLAGDIILHMCTKNHNICCKVPEIWSERHIFLLFWVIFIWCMVPEIWSTTEIIFCHSGLFFALLPPYGPRKSKFWKNEKKPTRYYHFTTVYHKWKSYDVWFLRYGVQQTKFFSHLILCHFGPFFALSAPWQPRKPKVWKN